ncbi:MAG: acyl-CoA dehydrogenase family protein, partial [Pseudomonadota bacterium]
NGQKVWTTLGHYADYMILLARTDPAAERKYAGLSFFLAPMKIPGVEARPIRKMTNEYGFTETFFTDARIPADCIMGAENQGWAIAMRTLQYERGAEAGAAGGPIFAPMRVADLIALAEATERDGKPATEDPVIQDQLVALAIEERALHASRHRAHIPALVNERPAALPLSEKLRGTELQRRLRLFAVGLQGAAGGVYVGDHSAVNGGEWQRAYMNNFGATIGGGTSQVQANIVGEMVLGLPK